MSDDTYIKAPCHECGGRISLPGDAVGVDFNCPHCGVDLQMLLKHICEHCGGKLSFDEHPDAIGNEIQCGHCQNATILQPSTFVTHSGSAQPEPQPAQENYPEEEEYYADEYAEDEGYEDEYEESYEEEYTEPEPAPRRGPPKPRPPKRRGPPAPRKPKGRPSPSGGGAGGADSGSAPMGRRLAGSGPKPEPEGRGEGAPKRQRPQPKRRSPGGAPGRPRPRRAQPQGDPSVQAEIDQEMAAGQVDYSHESESAGHVPGPAPEAIPTRRIAGTPTDNPMAGAAPMGGGAPAGAAPGPVQRKIAGSGGAAGGGPTPTFNVAAKDDEEEYDEDEGPWYKNREKQKLAGVIAVFVLVFLPFGLPNIAEIISTGSGKKIAHYTRLGFLFGGGGDYRNNSTQYIQIVGEMKFETSQAEGQEGVIYITGQVQNTSSDTFQQVELHFGLYDKDNTLLGPAVEYKDQMGPNETWEYKAACMFTNVARADLEKVIVR